MAAFTFSEQTDMIMLYGEARGNAAGAKRLYEERFPGRRIPDARTFTRTVQRLRESGSLKMNTRDIGSTESDRRLDAEDDVLERVEANPGVSTRRLAVQTNLSRSMIWRILHEQGFYPFHVQKVQALKPEDFPRRVQFCEWLLHQNDVDGHFVRKILATDEAGFTREGVHNSHNTHIWSIENPHAIQENRFQEQFSVNVWMGIVDDHLIGPYVLPPRLTGANYLEFLSRHLGDLLEDVPLQTRREMWYLQDGALPHYAVIVREWLNANYPNKWIGRSGPVPWPPRSPDLNPCDFFVWGHMKQLVYATPVDTVEELRLRVENAAQTIRDMPGVFGRVQGSWLRRARACIDNASRHFEQFL